MKTNTYNVIRIVDALADYVEETNGILVSRSVKTIPEKEFVITRKGETVKSYGKGCVSFVLDDKYYSIILTENPFRDCCIAKTNAYCNSFAYEPDFSHMAQPFVVREALWKEDLEAKDYKSIAKELLKEMKAQPLSQVEGNELITFYTKNS